MSDYQVTKAGAHQTSIQGLHPFAEYTRDTSHQERTILTQYADYIAIGSRSITPEIAIKT